MATLDSPPTALTSGRGPQQLRHEASASISNFTSPIVLRHNPYKKQKVTPSPPRPDKIPSSVGKTDEATCFFAALLQTSIQDYVLSEQPNEDSAARSSTRSSRRRSNPQKLELWHLLCRRMGVPIPENRLVSNYDDPELHFQHRAALVLEEARHNLATVLASRWQQPKPKRTTRNNKNNGTVALSVIPPQMSSTELVPATSSSSTSLSYPWFHANAAGSEWRSNKRVLQVTFEFPVERNNAAKARTDKRLRDKFKTGAVVECRFGRPHKLSKSFLAWMDETSQQIVDLIATRTFSVLFFHPQVTPALLQSEQNCDIRLVETCTSQQRQFSACLWAASSSSYVPFLQQLLGEKLPCAPPVATTPTASTTQGPQPVALTSDEERGIQLNASQEGAVTAFLNAPPKSITIVQGYAMVSE